MIRCNSQWRFRRCPAPPKNDLRRFTAAAARVAGLPETPAWSCDLLFVGDRRMAELNASLLGHEGTTDVITFCYFEEDAAWEEDEVMVELIVNPDAALREGAKRPGGYPYEMALYIVHGMLHSAGEDDLSPGPRRRMRRRERECLEILAGEFDFSALFPQLDSGK